MIQAVLYREQTCWGLDDMIADDAVKVGLRKDSSTGIGQIFAATAIRAEKIINPTSTLDSNNKSDLNDMWYKLQNDDTNIYYIGLVLKAEAKTMGIDLIAGSRDDYQKIIARYNGTGDEATNYASQTIQYYDLFKKYNSK